MKSIVQILVFTRRHEGRAGDVMVTKTYALLLTHFKNKGQRCAMLYLLSN